MTETNELAQINSFSTLRNHYIAGGFIHEIILTSEQRKKANTKAHVFQEYGGFEFKYIPLNGKHHYLFETLSNALVFNNYCKIKGVDLNYEQQ